ncbi:MAG: urease subunit beta [Pseudomonadota bacterium]|nr:urease subunit beta [Rubrivivax sp.]NLZ42653.1 urease subunit beta [Comamonadaceae bacterium]
MIPGEILCGDGALALEPGRTPLRLVVANTGRQPIEVGSHCHFAETNPALHFDRQAARGMRLAIASGSTLGFAPGEERVVPLVPYAGMRQVQGFRGLVNGPL